VLQPSDIDISLHQMPSFDKKCFGNILHSILNSITSERMRITLTGFGFFGKGTVLFACFFLLFGCKEKDLSLCQNSSENVVVITCGMVAHEYEACKKGVSRWMQKTGKKALVVPAPNGSNERLTLFQQHLAAESPDIDVYQVDVIWPGLLARHLIDLYPHLSEKRKAQYLPQLLKNNTVAGKLVSLPWFLNVGFLYYRKDLLERYGLGVPQTWEELEKTAHYIVKEENKRGNELWGYVFQGKAYEGLTCNAIEWIASYPHGGSIVELDGHVSINNPEAIYIVQKIADWIGVLSPPGVLNYEQEDCRGIFQLGKTIFMRNWPYAWVVLNNPESPVAGKVGIAILPKGGPHGQSSSVLGGWNLAVSKYSKRQKDAIDLVLFLTSEDELRRRAIEHGYYPPMQSLYVEEKIRSLSPITGLMLDVLKRAVPRPAGQTGAKYSQVSAIFWNMIYETLAHKGTAEKNLGTIEKKLNFISKNGTRWVKKP
jgi:trehalose/maltose transport system substrate-binding protein